MDRGWLWRLGKLAIMIGLFGAIFVSIDRQTVLDAFRSVSLVWLAAGLTLSIPQILLSALRWRWVSASLDQPLPFSTAVREYYVASFLNQILPGGVAGEAARIVRRGRELSRQGAERAYRGAAKSVVFERASGQAVMILLCLPGLTLIGSAAAVTAAGLLAALLAAILLLGGRHMARSEHGVVRLCREFRQALFGDRNWARHGAASALIVFSYVLVFWIAARAIGVGLSFTDALVILPPALLAMTLPITPAGWGVREAVSAVLWGAAGLSPALGVTAAIVYGVVTLISTLPGLLFLAFSGRTVR